ncbi:hypothetical protein U1Q18_013753 [Sarracenia purpurea var. burkii]
MNEVATEQKGDIRKLQKSKRQQRCRGTSGDASEPQIPRVSSTSQRGEGKNEDAQATYARQPPIGQYCSATIGYRSPSLNEIRPTSSNSLQIASRPWLERARFGNPGK